MCIGLAGSSPQSAAALLLVLDDRDPALQLPHLNGVAIDISPGVRLRPSSSTAEKSWRNVTPSGAYHKAVLLHPAVPAVAVNMPWNPLCLFGSRLEAVIPERFLLLPLESRFLGLETGDHEQQQSRRPLSTSGPRRAGPRKIKTATTDR